MPHDDEVFIPEQVDEQIEYLWDALHFAQPGQRSAPEMELIENLHRQYHQAQVDARSLDAVWERLTEQGAISQPPPRQRTRPPQSGSLPPERPRPPGTPAPLSRRRRRLPQLLVAIAAAFLLIAVVGGLVVGLVLVRHPNPVVSSGPTTQPTAQSTTKPGQTPQTTPLPTMQPGQTPQVTPLPSLAPPVVTYIASDGNLWETSISQGTTRQITTDAQANMIQYSGLAWSPDGSTLAVLRTAGNASTQNTTYTLVLLAANGAAPRFMTLTGPLDDRPFAWSPDSKLIAYRELTGQYLSSGNDKAILHILDAQSGQEIKPQTFDRGPSGCGGGGFGDLTLTIWAAHAAYEGIDTFAWAPDQQTMLVAYACFDGPSTQIDLSTGATLSVNYPKGASYQPGGTLILGLWKNGTLGLVDLSDNHVRPLVQPPPSGSGQYAVYLGWASWSPDGQTIYYEYEDSIWSIGADGSNAHQIVAGTPLDSQNVATAQLLPSLSPDGTLLLYLQAHGSTANDTNVAETNQWFVAHADGSNPVALPQGVSEAAWQPGG